MRSDSRRLCIRAFRTRCHVRLIVSPLEALAGEDILVEGAVEVGAVGVGAEVTAEEEGDKV